MIARAKGNRCLVLLICGAIAAIGIVAILLSRREAPLREVSLRVLDCIETADAGCVMSYVDKDEERTMQPTEEKVQRLLSEYLLPSLGSLQRFGKDIESPSYGNGRFVVIRNYQRKDGLRVALIAEATLTPEGTVAYGTLANIIYAGLRIRHSNPGEDEEVAFIRSVVKDKGTLVSLGFSGLYEIGQQRFMTWDEIESVGRMRLARRRSRGESVPPI